MDIINRTIYKNSNINIKLICDRFDFSKFVRWLRTFPDTLPLQIGVRGRPRDISSTGICMLSTRSYRQLVPSGWIVQYFSNVTDLQIRIQFDLPTTSVQPSSNLSFLFRPPSYPSPPFHFEASCRLNIILLSNRSELARVPLKARCCRVVAGIRGFSLLLGLLGVFIARKKKS